MARAHQYGSNTESYAVNTQNQDARCFLRDIQSILHQFAVSMLTEQMQLAGTEQRRELAWSLWWSAIAIALTVTHSVAHKPVAKLSTRDATNRQSRSRLRLGNESAADVLPVVGFSTSDEPISAKFLVQFWRVGLDTHSNTQCTAYYSFALLVDARFVVRWVLSMTKL